MSEANRDQVRRELSRQEILRYVELELWSRFRGRLWGGVAAALIITSLAALLGVPYYIRSEVDKRLKEEVAKFHDGATRGMRLGKLYSLLATQYSEQLSESHRRFYAILEGLSQARALEDESIKFSVDGVIRELTAVRWSSRPADVMNHSVFFILRRMPRGLQELQVIPGDMVSLVAADSATGRSATTVFGHPVQSGTLLGALTDLKFRLLSLEAQRRALATLALELGGHGGESLEERRREVASLEAILEEHFLPEYRRSVDLLSRDVLRDGEDGDFQRYRRYYELPPAAWE